MYTFRIFVKYLARLYVDVPQAEIIGCKGNWLCGFLANHRILPVGKCYLLEVNECIGVAPIDVLCKVQLQ